MDKRKDKRLKIREMVEVGDQSGMLLDISEDGIKLAMTSLPADPMVDIKLQLAGKSFNLKGEVRWVKKKYLSRSLNQVGIAFIDAPEDYCRILEKLLSPVSCKEGEKP